MSSAEPRNGNQLIPDGENISRACRSRFLSWHDECLEVGCDCVCHAKEEKVEDVAEYVANHGQSADLEFNEPDFCAGCGEPSTEKNPTHETVVSPPVSGYTLEMSHFHKECASRAAEDMVR